MYYTDDLILPENMAPLIITAAPYGPEWMPGDADIPVSWDEQVQAAVDCFNAGATMLHVHVRDPATGHGSVDFEQFNYFIGLLRQAVPKMIFQVGWLDLFRAEDDGRESEVAGLQHSPHADGTRSEARLCDDRRRHDAVGRGFDHDAG